MSFLEHEEWVSEALCAQVDVGDLWFPTAQDDGTQAKRVCGLCVVKAECLDYALSNDIPHGIWGGLGARSRLRMMRQKRRDAA
jgi:WhiB family redox-sensing transcriptional regulator